MPMYRTATVEQVAVNAVMAGCKPEYFPVVLAIAESGGGTGDGRGGGGAFIVSGPIYKEIGMNVTNFIFGPGNQVNKTIGRVGSLMWRNLGGYEETISTITTLGSPITNGGFMFAEYAEGLPKGWKGLNEELGFKKDESVLMTTGVGSWGHRPAAYARCLPVAATDRPRRHCPVPQRQRHPRPAQLPRVPDQGHLGDARRWLHAWYCRRRSPRTSATTASRPRSPSTSGSGSRASSRSASTGCAAWGTSPPTAGWPSRRRPGKPWRELPDDYMVPVAGNDPMRSYNIVVINMEETAPARYGGGKGQAYSIDAWR